MQNSETRHWVGHREGCVKSVFNDKSILNVEGVSVSISKDMLAITWLVLLKRKLNSGLQIWSAVLTKYNTWRVHLYNFGFNLYFIIIYISKLLLLYYKCIIMYYYYFITWRLSHFRRQRTKHALRLYYVAAAADIYPIQEPMVRFRKSCHIEISRDSSSRMTRQCSCAYTGTWSLYYY